MKTTMLTKAMMAVLFAMTSVLTLNAACLLYTSPSPRD